MPQTTRAAGRHFLQIPGPTPVPDRIMRAMDMPVIDHRGPEFQALATRVLSGEEPPAVRPDRKMTIRHFA
jgi:aspartate aminotransferase-like enzyme